MTLSMLPKKVFTASESTAQSTPAAASAADVLSPVDIEIAKKMCPDAGNPSVFKKYLDDLRAYKASRASR